MAFTKTPELRRAYHLNYTAKPDSQMKLAARAKCAQAIKAGKLVRQPCEGCGADNTEAHHDDYSKPLSVRWLCRTCHAAAHRRTHCARGHELTGENLSVFKDGRRCRACARNRRKR